MSTLNNQVVKNITQLKISIYPVTYNPFLSHLHVLDFITDFDIKNDISKYKKTLSKGF